MLQLADRLGLDLPHPLARHLEYPPPLPERVGVPVSQSVSQLDDLALSVGEGLEDMIDLILEHLLRCRIDRAVGGVVLDEFAEVAVFALPDRPVEADGVPRDPHHAAG